MSELTTPLLFALFSLIAAVFLALALASHLRRTKRKERERQKELFEVRAKLAAVQRRSIASGSRQRKLENLAKQAFSELSKVQSRQDQLEVRRDGGPTYEHAINLARGGAPIDELIGAGEINEAEAHLIRAMNRGSGLPSN